MPSGKRPVDHAPVPMASCCGRAVECWVIRPVCEGDETRGERFERDRASSSYISQETVDRDARAFDSVLAELRVGTQTEHDYC